jgi:cell division protein FtsW (lipid II flippase)
MKKVYRFLIVLLTVAVLTISISYLFEKKYDNEEFVFFSSNLVLDVLGQLVIFLLLLFFGFHKMKTRKVIFLFVLFIILMVSVDVFYYRSFDIRWRLTLESASIWVSPFLGILLLKIVNNFMDMMEAHKELQAIREEEGK